jgi:AAA+ ATPase superfamily predicted ATPase
MSRLRRALAARHTNLAVVYGRRRLGKSRLVQESLGNRRAVYYVGDERDAPLQREALARETDAVIEGFSAVRYPDWEALLSRFWQQAPDGAVLALDEFPALVARAPELASLFQKSLDRGTRPARHVILTGSSQRMMYGLVLDASAPLYGRAEEILRLEPLAVGWLRPAFGLREAADAVEHYSVWGGVPRYWELARSYPNRRAAIRTLVLDPLGVLHREPERLLLDELTSAARPASMLALIAAGANRLSEIAGRLAVPATSLSRPMALLVDLGLVTRDLPFGASRRDSKRSLYRLKDPFLQFWYGHVEPNRSRLEAGLVDEVDKQVQANWHARLGHTWEQLARATLPRLRVLGRKWEPPSRWWGRGLDGNTMELDLVARCAEEPDRVLVGEAKVTATAAQVRRTLLELSAKAERCPALQNHRVELAVWVLRPRGRIKSRKVVGAEQVVGRVSAA